MSESQASSTRSTSSLEAGELAWEREQCLAEIEPMRRAAQPIMKIHKRITEAIKNEASDLTTNATAYYKRTNYSARTQPQKQQAKQQ
jgi:hypothetical protein